MTAIQKNHVNLGRWPGPLILSHHPAKFGVHSPCESGNVTYFICHVTTISKSHVTLWVGSFHPNSPPLLSLGFTGLMELEIMTLVISVPIPVPIPIPRFQCRGLQVAVSLPVIHEILSNMCIVILF